MSDVKVITPEGWLAEVKNIRESGNLYEVLTGGGTETYWKDDLIFTSDPLIVNVDYIHDLLNIQKHSFKFGFGWKDSAIKPGSPEGQELIYVNKYDHTDLDKQSIKFRINEHELPNKKLIDWTGEDPDLNFMDIKQWRKWLEYHES